MVEQEHISQQTNNPDWSRACTAAQAEVLENYYDKYVIKIGLQATPADISDEEKGSGFRTSDKYQKVIE